MINLTIVFLLSACSGKGLDRKLNLRNFNESYASAFDEANHEERRILEKYENELGDRVRILSLGSVPDLAGGRENAKENRKELERINGMTMREFLVDHVNKSVEELNTVVVEMERFVNGEVFKVEESPIHALTGDDGQHVFIKGHVTLQNKSRHFDFFFNCAAKPPVLLMEGKRTGHSRWTNCTNMLIRSNGGRAVVEYEIMILRRDEVDRFVSLIESDQKDKMVTAYQAIPIQDENGKKPDATHSIWQEGKKIRSRLDGKCLGIFDWYVSDKRRIEGMRYDLNVLRK